MPTRTTHSLSEIKAAYSATISMGATPHRNPDFERIDKALQASYVDPDPRCWMTLMFMEEHNTGYDGVLYRWLVSSPEPEIQFWVDLVPETLSEE